MKDLENSFGKNPLGKVYIREIFTLERLRKLLWEKSFRKNPLGKVYIREIFTLERLRKLL